MKTFNVKKTKVTQDGDVVIEKQVDAANAAEALKNAFGLRDFTYVENRTIAAENAYVCGVMGLTTWLAVEV